MKNYFTLQWHLTDDCDQRCKHCYIWQKTRVESSVSLEQDKGVIKNFVRFCDQMGVLPSMAITGGDPLLYPYVWQILEELKRRKISFSILGNPFHLTAKVAQRLKGLGCEKYQMSLDGLEKTHDLLRKPGSFKTTLGAVPIIKNAGITCTIMSTVSLINYLEFPELARLCAEHKVNGFAFSRYCPNNQDTEHNIPALVYRQFLAKMWQVYSELVDGKTNFILKDHLLVAYLYEEGLYRLRDGQDIVFDGCNCGTKHMTLLPDGTVFACRRFDSPVGNIRNQSFKEIFSSEEMNQYRQIEKLDGCKDCILLNYCRGCHAVSAGTTGNYFSNDPSCWRID